MFVGRTKLLSCSCVINTGNLTHILDGLTQLSKATNLVPALKARRCLSDHIFPTVERTPEVFFVLVSPHHHPSQHQTTCLFHMALRHMSMCDFGLATSLARRYRPVAVGLRLPCIVFLLPSGGELAA